MASRYGKGDLCGITVGTETTYGILPTGSEVGWSHAGIMRTLSQTDDIGTEEVINCGSRAQGTLIPTTASISFKTTFWAGKSAMQVWINWLSNTDESKSIYLKIANSSVDLYTGCTLESLSIQSEGMGKPLLVTAEVHAARHQIGVSNPQTQNIDSAVIIATYGQAGMTGTDTAHLDTWTVTVADNRTGIAGYQLCSGVDLASAFGKGSMVGNRDISISASLPATIRYFDGVRLKRGTTRFILQGSKSFLITVYPAVVGGNEPSRGQSPYSETIEATASSVSIQFTS